MTEKIAFIGFGEAGQMERLGGKKTENRAELIAAIRVRRKTRTGLVCLL